MQIPTNKALGQHWLFDETALEAVVAAGEVVSTDTVLEIGPGPGALTAKLAQLAHKVIAVEADSELAEGLIVRVPADNLEVKVASILDYDFSELPPEYKVVANIPYYITSKIIRLCLENNNPPRLMALLVQKEVAERITALPGAMSVLAFSVQYYGEPRILGTVAKELFEPIPKVDSAILQIRRRPKPYFSADTKQLFRLVKAGFGERRKKLVNSLAGGLQADKTEVAQWLKGADIAHNVRAQELSMDEWHKLYKVCEPFLQS